MHEDHRPYFPFTSKARLEKAINLLVGIVEGIAIDAKITDREINFLLGWAAQYTEFTRHHPFNEVIPVVENAIADTILTREEHDDLIWICNNVTKSDYFDMATSDMQRLHGILAGTLADGTVTEEELENLSTWLAGHEHLRRCWPYDEVDSVVTAVMSDHRIDPEEQTNLRHFFSEFVAIYDDKTIKRPLVSEQGTLKGVCAICPEIRFKNSEFCLTGASSRYNRIDFENLIIKLGGIPKSTVTKSLDYLVIGAEGNPCWAYACYGRKVETAIELRKRGRNLLIVHENDFHDAVLDCADVLNV